MRAVTTPSFGGPDVLTVSDVPDAHPGPGEVVVEVAATAINRADLQQRKGYYPPPSGVTDVLGLECSGTIGEVGAGVDGWRPGDRVCALLAGGGYAEKVTVPAGQVMPVPDGLDLVAAAALPETAATAWSNLVTTARLVAGETLIVHGGAGGVGTTAIQIACALGARVLATAGSPEKLDLCRRLGAADAFDYRADDLRDRVRAATDGRGVDVVLDNMGASNLGLNVDLLATGGRLVVIGLQGGVRAELHLAKLLMKRGSVLATSLRSRPLEEKSAVCRDLVEHVWPMVASGAVRPVVHRTLALDDVAEGHRLLEDGSHVGKVLLTVATTGD